MGLTTMLDCLGRGPPRKPGTWVLNLSLTSFPMPPPLRWLSCPWKEGQQSPETWQGRRPPPVQTVICVPRQIDHLIRVCLEECVLVVGGLLS